MKLLGLRLLRGPNVHAMQPCCVGLIEFDEGEGDAMDAAGWARFGGRFAAPAASAIPGPDGGVDPQAPATLAHAVGQVALALQRDAGAAADHEFVDVVPSPSERRQFRVACSYRFEAVGERALQRAVDAVDAVRHDRPFDLEAARTAIRSLAAAREIDAGSAALLEAARRRGIPVLRLDEGSRRFQLGWGRRQHRIDAGAPDAAAAAAETTNPAPLDALFPPGNDGRIPLVAITGTNGKTTTTLLVSHAVRTLGAAVGTTTTSGVLIGDRMVERGDCTGYWSARTVLTSGEVEAAVLETARGGIVKRGLAFDRCDVGVVLNISGDHLGLDGVETLADLARVKGLVARCASRAAVLNADDALCVGMRDGLRPGCETVFFSMDATSPVLRAHRAAGGRAAWLECGRLVWCDGENHLPLVEAASLPVTLGGHARYNVANALAALAALVCMGYEPGAAATALSSFVSDARSNPLRSNVFDVRGFRLIVDYAHNVAAYSELCAMARSFLGAGGGRLVGVVTSPGDRRAGDLQAVGRVCGERFDELVVYEQDPRGRSAGETVEAILSGARSAAAGSADKPLHGVPPIRQALALGISRCRAGDVLVFTCAGSFTDLVEGVRQVDAEAADRIAEKVPSGA